MKPQWCCLKVTQCFLRQCWLNVWSSQSTLGAKCFPFPDKPLSNNAFYLLLNSFCWLNIQGQIHHCTTLLYHQKSKQHNKGNTELVLGIKLSLYWIAQKYSPRMCLIPINSYSLATVISSGRMLPMTSITTSAQIVEGWKTPNIPISHQILLYYRYLNNHGNIRWQKADPLYPVNLNILIFLSKLHFPFKPFHLISVLKAQHLSNSCPGFSRTLPTIHYRERRSDHDAS